jgi:MFS transporter, DHA3 family, macrolide efflux protein
MMNQKNSNNNSMRTFFIIWAGQLLSTLGSGMTGFAMGIWVFKKTGSATQFAVIALASTLPAVLISPLAGALVDRWHRKRVMIFSDAASAVATLAAALLFWTGQLEVWHILIISALGSTLGAFQGPAWSASVTLLVPKKHFGRASGLAQMSRALSSILSPLLAGLLMMYIGLHGVILIDFATFLMAVATLIAVKIPQPETTEPKERRSLLRESREGWSFIHARAGLLAMLILFTILNFLLSMVNALAVPMILSFTSEARLGAIFSLSGVGMLLGSVLMSIWGGPKNRIHGLLVSLVLIGVGFGMVGLRPTELVVISGFFLTMFCVPFASGSVSVIWRTKVPAELQGRVFATLGMVAMAAMPLAYLISGPLADRIFIPLLLEGGKLAGSVGQIIGVGPGRGIGLMFTLSGLSVILVSLIAYLNPRLRNVETELPNMIEDESEEAADTAMEETSTPADGPDGEIATEP